MRIPKFLMATIVLFNLSQSLFAQTWQISSGSYYANAPVAAANGSSGFTQMWHDNAVIWKYGNSAVGNGLRFGSATDLGANNWTERMRISDNGLVGIGTSNPQAALSLGAVFGAGKRLLVYDNGSGSVQAGLGVDMSGTSRELSIFHSTSNGSDGDISLGKRLEGTGAYTEAMRITGAGNVGIGTADTKTYKLAVNGNAIFTKVVVKTFPWPDYVFHGNYRLRSLNEVEQYIKQHHHLPEVPSAEEVEKEGLNLGDNQAVLLKKIEELTLYVIEQNKRIGALEAEVKSMKGKRK